MVDSLAGFRLLFAVLPAKYVAERSYIPVVDQSAPRAMLLSQTPHDLGSEDVDLTVQQASAFGYFALLGGQPIGEFAQLLIAVRLNIDKAFERSVVHGAHALTIEVPPGTFNLRWRYVEMRRWAGRPLTPLR
jgi:hypothetical protein